MRLMLISSIWLSLISLNILAGEHLQFDVVQTEAEERISIYLQNDKARIISSANGQVALIFRKAEQKLYILNHTNKTLTTLDQVKLDQLASVVQGVGELARAQGGILGDLFETFGFANEMGSKSKVEVKTLPGLKKVSGLDCQMQQVFEDDQLATQLCLANTLHISPTEAETLSALISFAHLLALKGQDLLAQFGLPIPLLPSERVEGVPVYINDARRKITATLYQYGPLDIAAAQFSIPTGYTESVLGL